MSGKEYVKHWDYSYVLLSYINAFQGAWVGLSLIQESRDASKNGESRGQYLSLVFFVQLVRFCKIVSLCIRPKSIGLTGIWSMHYVGMAALILPVKTVYNPFYVALSAVVCVAVVFYAIYIVSIADTRKYLTRWNSTERSYNSSTEQPKVDSDDEKNVVVADVPEEDEQKDQVLRVPPIQKSISLSEDRKSPSNGEKFQFKRGKTKHRIRQAMKINWLTWNFHMPDKTTMVQIVKSGIVMGIGVSLMHYCGMLAMYVDARQEWDYGIIILSVVIAIIDSMVGLFVLTAIEGLWPNVLSAMVIALAVCGMHYSGMYAVRYFPQANRIHPPSYAWGDNPILISVIANFTRNALSEGIRWRVREQKKNWLK
ncbi:hypothetical protein RFI_09775 [Reticulomyxa filosa]|uniref:MHYT domain-containing protein n=1 Tax=Reticulomyxa filosa TaxID=46433 RepID=X6NPP9_RETFI|nr:hypothetical protein RFI_09775 [Reticulomyxa filosa]|eukprot:ETO27357.1 hypothetical protein RFI_09775 [Reticulomyxa filosa]